VKEPWKSISIWQRYHHHHHVLLRHNGVMDKSIVAPFFRTDCRWRSGSAHGNRDLMAVRKIKKNFRMSTRHGRPSQQLLSSCTFALRPIIGPTCYKPLAASRDDVFLHQLSFCDCLPRRTLINGGRWSAASSSPRRQHTGRRLLQCVTDGCQNKRRRIA